MTCFSLFMVSLGKENSENTMKLEKNDESCCEFKLPGIFKEFLS